MEPLPIPRVDELTHAVPELTDGRWPVGHTRESGDWDKVLSGPAGARDGQGLLPGFALRGGQHAGRADFDPGPKVAVLQGDPNRLQAGTKQLETLSVAGRQLLLAVDEAQSLELLDPAVAGRDRNSEPAAEFQRGHGAFEGPHEDPGGVLVHHGLAQLQRLHHIQSPRSPRIRETRLVISSASKGLFTYPMAPRRTLSISVKLSPKAVMRIARRPGFTRRAVGERADDVPGSATCVGRRVPPGVDFRQQSVRLELLEMERKLRGGVDEVLLQDRGIRHGSGDKDKAHDGPADRVREGLEHSLEDHGRGSRLRFETDIGSEGRIRRPKDQRTAFRCAFPAHVADPGPEVFPTVHRLDQVEVIGVDHGTFDAVQISFDRGVQMVQLRRGEDVRRSALVRDAEDQRSARRRFRARSKHGDESGTTRGLGNDVGDLRVAPDRPEQRAGGPFLLHHVEGPPERFQLIRFLDEVDRPSLHRLDRGVDRPLARDHDHGGLGPHNPEPMQDLQSGGFGHPKVEEGHVERLPLDRAKRFTPVRGGDDGVSVLTQERGELFPEGLVVIRDENLHAASLRGRRTVTVVPRPGSEATSREPPCPVAMCFARSKPRPIPSPSTFVAETGSNRWATTSGVIPLPVSATVTANACGRSSTRTRTDPFAVECIALSRRWTNSSWISSGSTIYPATL